MKTYSILLARINDAKTIEELKALEKQIENHYDNRTLTVKEYGRLDVKVMEKIVKKELELESKQNEN